MEWEQWMHPEVGWGAVPVQVIPPLNPPQDLFKTPVLFEQLDEIYFRNFPPRLKPSRFFNNNDPLLPVMSFICSYFLNRFPYFSRN